MPESQGTLVLRACLGPCSARISNTIPVPSPQIYWVHMVYAALGAICFTLFLAYDTQLVLGNRKHTISPEDYITGALQIYTDIVYIFTFVLQLVGSRD